MQVSGGVVRTSTSINPRTLLHYTSICLYPSVLYNKHANIHQQDATLLYQFDTMSGVCEKGAYRGSGLMKGQCDASTVVLPGLASQHINNDSGLPPDETLTADAPLEPLDPITPLPSEIVDRICAILHEQGSIDELAALRLISRCHIGVVNEHLFRTIHLARQMTSLLRFRNISRSPLSRFVHHVKVRCRASLRRHDLDRMVPARHFFWKKGCSWGRSLVGT